MAQTGEPLMPTQPYVNAAGKRLPGVTTVIGSSLGWNKDALIRWANREGLEGRNVRDPAGKAAKAADIGSAGHDMIELHVHGQDPETAASLIALSQDDRLAAQRAFGSFARWLEDTKIRVIGTELWGVDELYQVGFCPDGVGVRGSDVTVEAPVQGKLTGELEEQLIAYSHMGHSLVLLDWKTGKGVYAEHFIQVATYVRLLELRLSERANVDIRFDSAIILGVRPNGLFKHLDFPRHLLDDGWLLFTYLRAIYSKRWEIEGLLK